MECEQMHNDRMKKRKWHSVLGKKRTNDHRQAKVKTTANGWRKSFKYYLNEKRKRQFLFLKIVSFYTLPSNYTCLVILLTYINVDSTLLHLYHIAMVRVSSNWLHGSSIFLCIPILISQLSPSVANLRLLPHTQVSVTPNSVMQCVGLPVGPPREKWFPGWGNIGVTA